jgi:hypothetical protein
MNTPMGSLDWAIIAIYLLANVAPNASAGKPRYEWKRI